MTAQLSVTSHLPAAPLTTIDIAATGFQPRVWYSVLFNGSGVTTKFKARHDGSFNIGVDVPSTMLPGTYTVSVAKSGTTTPVVASVLVTVALPDTTPPTITTVVTPTNDGARIDWTTNEHSSGYIEWGPDAAYGNKQSSNLITGQQPGQVYHFRVVAVDDAGNVSSTADATFTVLAAPPPPPPPPPPPVGKTVTVAASWSAILAAIADLSIDTVLVSDGTLGHGDIRNAVRNSGKPVVVRAVNRWGVKCNGGGSNEFISINDGACYITLDGFEFVNGDTDQGGCIVLGGQPNTWAACHHLNFLNMRVSATVTGPAVKGSTNGQTGHGLYFGAAIGGHHDIVGDGWVVDNQFHGVASAVQFYHSDTSKNRLNAWNVVFKNATIKGVTQAIIIWDGTVHDVVIGPNVRIDGASPSAVRHESGSAILDDVVSINCGSAALVNHGTGLTVKPNCSFH